MRPSLVEIQGHPPPNAPSPLSFQAHIETGGEGRMSVQGTALLFLLGVCHSDVVRPRLGVTCLWPWGSTSLYKKVWHRAETTNVQ